LLTDNQEPAMNDGWNLTAGVKPAPNTTLVSSHLSPVEKGTGKGSMMAGDRDSATPATHRPCAPDGAALAALMGLLRQIELDARFMHANAGPLAWQTWLRDAEPVVEAVTTILDRLPRLFRLIEVCRPPDPSADPDDSFDCQALSEPVRHDGPSDTLPGETVSARQTDLDRLADDGCPNYEE
jgi:hypothetical protein